MNSGGIDTVELCTYWLLTIDSCERNYGRPDFIINNY
jgi:hypothetical protein